MNLLECEAKSLLHQHAVPVPVGRQFSNPQSYSPADYPLVLKVQIPKGGRGKAGGIITVQDHREYVEMAERLLNETILECPVSSLLAEEVLDYDRELYLAITIDRASATIVLLAHRNGGIDIEQAIAAPGSEPMLRLTLTDTPDTGVVSELQAYYDLPDDALRRLEKLLAGLYETFIQEDAILIEINPLMVLKDDSLVCADAKIELDDAAAFRHVERKFESQVASSQFVELNSEGTVASMANGAGLAMATVDAIKTAGALPANFFDVGGGTNVQGMVQAFAKIAAMPNVASIVVNIFGGITRCDEVAEAIIEAKKVCSNLPQLYIRLTGTNEAQGKKLLEAAGIPFYQTLAACVAEAVK